MTSAVALDSRVLFNSLYSGYADATDALLLGQILGDTLGAVAPVATVSLVVLVAPSFLNDLCCSSQSTPRRR